MIATVTFTTPRGMTISGEVEFSVDNGRAQTYWEPEEPATVNVERVWIDEISSEGELPYIIDSTHDLERVESFANIVRDYIQEDADCEYDLIQSYVEQQEESRY